MLHAFLYGMRNRARRCEERTSNRRRIDMHTKGLILEQRAFGTTVGTAITFGILFAVQRSFFETS